MKNFLQNQFTRSLLFVCSGFLISFIQVDPSELTQPSFDLESAEACNFQQLDSEGFESGWGIWEDGGEDAFRYESSYHADKGIYSILLRDDGPESTITTEALDLSAYSELKVSFSFFVRQFENEEDFWLQISTDGGNSFQTLASWEKGIDFLNGERHLEEVSIKGPFTEQTHLRFRCDASGNRDYLFLDEVEIAGCEESKSLQNFQSCTATGGILMERWNGIGDAHGVDKIPINTPPTETLILTSFEIPVNAYEEYGVRMRGYICPPQTGNYTFWISSDDNGELWLSPDQNPANKERIAHVPGWTQSRVWEKYPEQRSVSITLQQGKSYYVEALMKEGRGGDNLAVKWQKPDGSSDQPIAGAYLSPYERSSEGELCDEGGEILYRIEDSFESGTGDFIYEEDVFFGTNAPAYSLGQWTPNVGPTGGSSLGVFLGGRDNADIRGMSAGWTHTFSLSEDANVNLSFWYNLTMYEGYEPDEYSEVVYSIDGNAKAVVRLFGDGNGGLPMSTGWQSAEVNLGELKAGTHKLILGGYNNRKTFNGERTDIYIDIVGLNALSIGNRAPKSEFTWEAAANDASLTIHFDASQSADAEGESLTYNWDFGNGEMGTGETPQYTYATPGTYRVSLLVTDASGCQSSVMQEIGVELPTPSPLSIEVIPQDATSCGGKGSVQITSNRGEVVVTDPNGNLIDKSNWEELNPGMYSWTLTAGDEEQKGSFEIGSRFEFPKINNIIEVGPSCDKVDGRVDISFENNPDRDKIEFSIDGGDTFPLNVSVADGQASFTDLAAGNYELSVRWGNDQCKLDLGSISLEVPSPPTVTIDPTGPFEATAAVQRLSASPLGGVWSGAVSADGIFDPAVGPGFHEVQYAYTDAKGCSASDQILIEVSQVQVPCIASITPIPPVEVGTSPIQLSASPSGGFWTGPISAEGIFDPGNCSGEYLVIYTYTDGASCFESDTLKITVQDPVQDIFIYAGQSNAVGAQGAPQYLAVGPEPEDTQIDYAWSIPGEQASSEWENLQLLQMDPIRKGHGAEISIARYLFHRGYTNMGLIKFAKGGTSLNYNWDPNTTLKGYEESTKNGMYPAMRNFVNAQLNNLPANSYRISGFLWHQGEGDMNPSMAPKYKDNLLNFVSSLRKDFGQELKVFMASVYNPNATPAEVEAIRQAQLEVAEGDPRVYIVNLDSIYYDADRNPSSVNVGPDQLHYNSTGLVKVGNAFGRMVKTLAPRLGCEEEVGTLCDSPENLAYQRPASQSSTYGIGTADLAVDGSILGSSPWTADLAHTQIEPQPWWQVDLGGMSTIEQVRIFNRSNCCTGRLNNFSIFVSESPFPSDATLISLQNDPTVSWIPFSGEAGLKEIIGVGKRGRYVRIQHSREVQMHLAEVEVWGCKEASFSSRFESANGPFPKEDDKPSISLFPNPTEKVLLIKAEKIPSSESLEFVLYNASGQRVWQSQGQEGITSVNVSELARGMYVLQTRGENWTDVQQILLR